MPILFNFVKHYKHLFDMIKSNIYGLSIVLLALLFVQCTSKSKELNKKLIEMADNLNESTPAVLDQYTRFDSVSVTSDNIFQYYYTLINITNPQELLNKQKEEIINNMGEAFTTDKSLRIFTENEVTLQYIYRDTTHNVIDVITIDSDKYKRFPN